MDYCQLARMSLSYWLNNSDYYPNTELSQQRSGCFVSLHSENGELRGCMGTLQATEPHLYSEIIKNAVAAGLRDPRFPPITLDELNTLAIEVQVLSDPEEIASSEDLNPTIYGVIVYTEEKRGVLLPDLEGVNSTEIQIKIARKKAGIHKSEPYKLMRFTVEKHSEHS